MDCEVDGGENVTSKLAILLKMILKSEIESPDFFWLSIIWNEINNRLKAMCLFDRQRRISRICSTCYVHNY